MSTSESSSSSPSTSHDATGDRSVFWLEQTLRELQDDLFRVNTSLRRKEEALAAQAKEDAARIQELEYENELLRKQVAQFRALSDDDILTVGKSQAEADRLRIDRRNLVYVCAELRESNKLLSQNLVEAKAMHNAARAELRRVRENFARWREQHHEKRAKAIEIAFGSSVQPSDCAPNGAAGSIARNDRAKNPDGLIRERDVLASFVVLLLNENNRPHDVTEKDDGDRVLLAVISLLGGSSRLGEDFRASVVQYAWRRLRRLRGASPNQRLADLAAKAIDDAKIDARLSAAALVCRYGVVASQGTTILRAVRRILSDVTSTAGAPREFLRLHVLDACWSLLTSAHPEIVRSSVDIFLAMIRDQGVGEGFLQGCLHEDFFAACAQALSTDDSHVQEVLAMIMERLSHDARSHHYFASTKLRHQLDALLHSYHDRPFVVQNIESTLRNVLNHARKKE